MTKHEIYSILYGDKSASFTSRLVNGFVIVLILLNVIAVILESVATIHDRFRVIFHWFEIISVLVFSIEYLVRIVVCTESARYRNPITGRIKYSLTPLALLDLFAILPFYLTFITVDLRILRILRVLRILRILKLAHYSAALRTFGNVLSAKKAELVLTLFFLVIMLIVSSAFMFYAEKDAQPDVFSSIPMAMWWGITTLTTVGYGDAYPITFVGRLLGSFIAIIGIGMFALPAGILSSGLLEEIQSSHNSKNICPHCGGSLDKGRSN